MFNKQIINYIVTTVQLPRPAKHMNDISYTQTQTQHMHTCSIFTHPNVPNKYKSTKWINSLLFNKPTKDYIILTTISSGKFIK